MTRRFPRALLALALVTSGLTSAGAAAAEGRCSLVGQMAGSVWLEMIQALGGDDSDKVASAISRIDSLTATYARLECDQGALNAAFDCVLTDRTDIAPRALLRQCMADAGISGQ